MGGREAAEGRGNVGSDFSESPLRPAATSPIDGGGQALAAKPLDLNSQISNLNSFHDHHPLRLQKEGMKMERRVTDSRRPKSMEKQAMALLKSGRAA